MHALPRLQCSIGSSTSRERVALGSPPRSLREDADAESARKKAAPHAAEGAEVGAFVEPARRGLSRRRC